MRIISPEERLAEPRGVHALIIGPYGIGKTSLLKTLDPASTLFVDGEDGALAVHDVPAAHVRPQTWQETKDLVVRIAGPSPAFGPNEDFSQAHFDRAGGYLENLSRYTTIFFDGVSMSASRCFHWAKGQPEATSERGKADLRGAYGLHARDFLAAMRHLQSARALNVIMTGTLESPVDDYGRITHRLQAEGQRIAREIPGIVDLVITMNAIDFGDGQPLRAFVCTAPNFWNFPAKDRSGKLEQVEPPHLGALIAKILPAQGAPSSAPEAVSNVRIHPASKAKE